jgi:hypothetical protein
LLRSFIVAAACALVLTLLAVTFGAEIGGVLLPVIRQACALLAPELVVRNVALVHADGQWVYRLDLVSGPFTFVGGQHVPADLDMYGTTLLGHALQHPVLLLSVIAGWPGLGPWQRVKAALCGLVLLAPVELLDVPMVLLGSIWDLLYSNFAPGDWSLTVRWMNFMNGGGRLALALAGAGTAVLIAEALP